jgi:ribonuclease Z
MFHIDLKSKIGEDICMLVRPDNHPWNYICECGDASDLTVKEIQNTNAVFISHTHIDHFVNFDAIIRHQIGIGRRVIICGPAGIAKQVQAKIMAYTWNLIEEGAIIYEIREVLGEDNYVTVYELRPPIWKLSEIGILPGDVLFEEKNFEVSGILLDHKIPTFAYKFKEKDTVKIEIDKSGFTGGKWVQELKAAYESGNPAQSIIIEGQVYPAGDLFHLLHTQIGDSLGIIMDHAANAENHEKILAHFSHCNTVLIESFYKATDQAMAEANFHSYSSKSGEVMRLANVKEAIPVHFSRRYTDADIAELVAEFERALLG